MKTQEACDQSVCWNEPGVRNTVGSFACWSWLVWWNPQEDAWLQWHFVKTFGGAESGRTDSTTELVNFIITFCTKILQNLMDGLKARSQWCIHSCWIIFLTLSIVIHCDLMQWVLRLFPCPDPEGDVVSLHRDLIQKLSFLCFYFIFFFFCFSLL